jgi:hypothetical protein
MPESRLTKEILAELRRPFEPAAVKFKGQSANQAGDKALVVPYIDARLVIERLNHVVGGDWSQTYELMGQSLWCHLTVLGETRPDLGANYEGKGLVSDALKRAGVQFGIGVSVYASPSVWLAKGNHCDIRGEGGKRKIYLKEPGIAAAAKVYADWLESHGKAAFGEPLGHGDVAESAGLEADETEPGAGEAGAAAPVPLVDVEADTLRQAARGIYAEIVKLKGGRTKLPPARFQEQLMQASTSHDSLREFAAELRNLVDDLKGEG